MTIKFLLDYILNCLNSNEIKNSNLINILEYIRCNTIERLRTENNKTILNLIDMIKKNGSINENLKIKDVNINIFFNYYDKKQIVKKSKSTSNVLEIALSGQKNYQIFDKIDKNKYISYKIMPFYGVVYSSDTVISSITVKNTSILNINIEDNLMKE